MLTLTENSHKSTWIPFCSAQKVVCFRKKKESKNIKKPTKNSIHEVTKLDLFIHQIILLLKFFIYNLYRFIHSIRLCLLIWVFFLLSIVLFFLCMKYIVYCGATIEFGYLLVERIFVLFHKLRKCFFFCLFLVSCHTSSS